MPTPTPMARQTAATQAPQRRGRFVWASSEHIESSGDVSLTLGTASQSYDVPASGFFRSMMLYVTATTAGNSANTAFQADAPWSAISEITLVDVQGTPIIAPISGYELYLINKYGGYSFMSDPTLSPAYTTTTGTGATGGSFGFCVVLPVEVLSRDALAALANQSSAAQYRWRVTIGASGDIYSTAPTAAPSVRIRSYYQGWTVPPASINGMPVEQTPPALGVVQNWSKQVVTLAAGGGYQTPRLQRVGNSIRNIILVARNSSNARATGILPADFSLVHNGFPLHSNVNFTVWQDYIQRQYGFSAAAKLDDGVQVFPFTSDLDGHPGGELRDQYLRTNTGSRLEYQGTFGAGSTLTILVNDVLVPDRLPTDALQRG